MRLLCCVAFEKSSWWIEDLSGNTNLRSNSRTEPSDPTDANKSRPPHALVKAIS